MTRPDTRNPGTGAWDLLAAQVIARNTRAAVQRQSCSRLNIATTTLLQMSNGAVPRRASRGCERERGRGKTGEQPRHNRSGEGDQ